MKNRQNFKFYRTFFESVQGLTNKQRLDFYEAIFNYSFNYELPTCKGVSLVMFNLMQPILKKSNDGYLSAYPSKDPSKDPTYKEKEKDNKKDKDNKKEKETSLPTLSEAHSYMDIKNYLEANASKLIEDFEFVLEDRLIKVSPKGKLYDVKQVDDLIKIDFELETRALKYLLNNKGLLK